MMQAESSPYEGKLCRILIKSNIIFRGKMTSMYVEAKITQWAREGLYLDEGSFIPWSTISALAPLEAFDAPGGTQAVELTKDELWYLWSLASDDRAWVADRDENLEAIAQSARKKLLKFVHPNCAEV